jgi:hypothetical protein
MTLVSFFSFFLLIADNARASIEYQSIDDGGNPEFFIRDDAYPAEYLLNGEHLIPEMKFHRVSIAVDDGSDGYLEYIDDTYDSYFTSDADVDSIYPYFPYYIDDDYSANIEVVDESHYGYNDDNYEHHRADEKLRPSKFSAQSSGVDIIHHLSKAKSSEIVFDDDEVLQTYVYSLADGVNGLASNEPSSAISIAPSAISPSNAP